MTADLTNEILTQALEKGWKVQMPVLPCHSQTVERAVKLTSEASHLVYGQEARHRHIITKYSCRQLRPAFASKGTYTHTYEQVLE